MSPSYSFLMFPLICMKHTVLILIELKLKKIIVILTFAQFSGKGHQLLH